MCPQTLFLFYNRMALFAMDIRYKKPLKKGGAGEMWVSPASYEKKFLFKQALEVSLFIFLV